MINKAELEELVLRDDIYEYFSKMSKEEVENILGDKFSRMIGYDQKNIHHCYDLFGHTLKTVEGVSKEEINTENLKKLRIAALFHDIGKPDVARINPKTGQQVFYNHAQKSSEIAQELLKDFGYDDKEVSNICFYIKHHDDFISYKTNIEDYMKTHEFIREINCDTLAEKVLENKYDFQKMGLDKDQIRYACYTLARGREPKFTSPSGIIDINVDMDEVKEKMASEEYMNDYIPTREDYSMLLRLCKADANAQTELYKDKNSGKVLCSRKDKIENIEQIQKSIDEAFLKEENISFNVRFEKNIIDQIVKEAKNKTELSKKSEELEDLLDGYRELLEQEKNKNKEDKQL